MKMVDPVIKIANEKETKDFQELLFNVYCVDLGWHSPNEFPNKIFTDEDDSRSTFLTVYQNDILISGVRVVADGTKGFPHEKISGVNLPKVTSLVIKKEILSKLENTQRSQIMEITRFIGNPKIRKIHTYDLMKALYWFGISHNVKIYFMTVDMSAFLLCHKLKFFIIPISTPVFCEGSWTIPAILITEDMPTLLVDKNKEYFLSTANLAWI